MRQQENSASDQLDAAAVRFDPLKLDGSIGNWMSHDLAVARAAIRLVGKTETELEAFVRELVMSGEDGGDALEALIHDLERAADAFKVVREIVQAAGARLLIVIARIDDKENHQ